MTRDHEELLYRKYNKLILEFGFKQLRGRAHAFVAGDLLRALELLTGRGVIQLGELLHNFLASHSSDHHRGVQSTAYPTLRLSSTAASHGLDEVIALRAMADSLGAVHAQTLILLTEDGEGLR